MNCPRCDQPISEHEAGPETDACVAMVVMGWRQLEEGGPLVHPNTNLLYGYDKKDDIAKYVPPLSTSITDAWKVVEKMKSEKIGSESGFRVEAFDDYYHAALGVYHEYEVIAENAPTAPLAICRVALKCQSSNS